MLVDETSHVDCRRGIALVLQRLGTSGAEALVGRSPRARPPSARPPPAPWPGWRAASGESV